MNHMTNRRDSIVISNGSLDNLENVPILSNLKPIIRDFFNLDSRNFVAYYPIRDSEGDERVLLGFRIVYFDIHCSNFIFYSRYKQQQVDFFGLKRDMFVKNLERIMFKYPNPRFDHFLITAPSESHLLEDM